MRNWCKATIGCCLLLTVTLALPAGVSWAGIVIHVPADYPTIQAGVDAAVTGDTVLVASGTYTGPGNRDVDFGNRNIVLMSAGGAGLTTIDCQGAARGITLHGHVNYLAVVDGFTIRNGNAPLGGGISVRSVNSPTIRNCVFIENTATEMGGGVFVGEASAPTFENCTIEQNNAPDGGGIGVGHDDPGLLAIRVQSNDGLVTTFVDCTISGNQADRGGGVFVNAGGVPLLDHCTITGNLAADGGGLMTNGDGAPNVSRCTIAANRAASNGGGMYVACVSPVSVTQTIVWSNCADGSGDQVYTTPGASVSFACGDVDDSGVEGGGTVQYDGNTIHADPLFCGEYFCTSAPTTAGDYTVDDDSPALAAHSPCEQLIGSKPQGCTGRSFKVGGGNQFAKIQDAIDKSVSAVDDTVLVDDDTWSGPRNTELDFGGKKIILKSRGGASQAIIDGGNSVRGIVFQNGESKEAVVEGFTFTRGAAGVPGSAVFVGGESSPVIRDCVIKQNDGETSAVRVESGNPAFKSCTIEENTVTGMGGVLEFVGGNPTLESCIVRNNAAPTAVNVATPMAISATQITDNGGCGLYLAPSSSLTGFAELDSTVLPESEMVWPVIENSDISRNADRGVVIDGSSAVFDGVMFRENGDGGVIVTGLGAAPLAAGSSGAPASTAAVTTSNQFTNCEFSGHSTDRGAGFYFDCTNEPEGAYTVTFTNCRITGNHATFEGGGVAICGRATNADITPVFVNCTIAANSAQDGGGVYMGVTQVGIGRLARADFSKTILWGNCSTVSPLGEAFVLTNNQMEIGCSHSDVNEIAGTGVIHATQTTTGIPDFCDYPSSYYSQSCQASATIEGDFFLAPNSPAAPANHPCGPNQIGAFPVGNCTPTAINDQPVRVRTSIQPPAPNPFNPVTSVEFTLETGTYVTVKIYDVNGRLARTLVDRPMTQGEHRIEWDGRDQGGNPAASGVYFLRFEAGQTRQTHKMVLLK